MTEPEVPKRPPTQSSEDRDLAAMKRRAEEAVPKPENFEEITKPTDIVARSGDRWNKDESFREEMSAAIDRYERDPAYRAMWNAYRRGKRESDQVSEATANVALKAAHAATISPSAEMLERIDKIEEQLHRLDSVLRVAKWILGMCIAGVLGAVVTVGLKIYSEGYDKGQLVDRVDHLEKALERHVRNTENGSK